MKQSENRTIYFLIFGPLIGVIIGLFLGELSWGIPIGMSIGAAGHILFTDEEK